MPFIFINKSDEIVQNKINFVFKVFQYFFGKIEKNIKIFYGSEDEQTLEDYDIIIIKDNRANIFFSKFEKFDISDVKYFQIEGMEIPILFHNNSSNAFIYKENNKQLIIKIDIFASAFYFLSLWDEYVSKERDVHNRCFAKNSTLYKLNFLEKPLVTIYFNFLKTLICKYFNIPLSKKTNYAVITHDIDYIKKWSPGIIYRECFQYFLFNKLKTKFNDRLQRLIKFLKAFSKNYDPYKISFNRIIQFELTNNITSTFFIKTGCTSKHDVSYSVKNKYLLEKISFLKSKEFDFGLHPSYMSYNDEIIMTREKNRLNKLLGNNNFGVRQHYLRYDVSITPILHDKLNFIYDSSLGYHDEIGFRTGFSYPHNLFDIKNDRVLKIIEVPLNVMDSTLEFYKKLSYEKSIEKIKHLVDIVEKYGGVLTLLFHNTCYDELDYNGWGIVFEDSIKYLKERNFKICSIGRLLDILYN